MSSESLPKFGRYELTALLGRGAMGLVYRAHDARLGRDVALKTLAPGILTGDQAEQLKERFLTEGRAAGRLRHPAIVAVYDADEDPVTGTAYLAMEFIEGSDLRARMKKGIDVESLVAILSAIADGLAHAHERGVIHRDVKPANVLLDEAGHPHLTDFGIARLGDSTLTQDGEFLGTPAYMAPEQVRSRPVSPQTDIYALGVMLYEGLTGRRPFEGDSMVATATAIATDPPVPPSAAGFVSTAFDSVILRALDKDPSKRHANAAIFAAEMKDALRQSASQTGVAVPSIPLPPEPSARKHRALLAAGALLLVALVIVAMLLGGNGSQQADAGEVEPAGAETTTGTGTGPGIEAETLTETETATATEKAPATRDAATAPRPSAPKASAPRNVPKGSLAVRATSPKKGVLVVSAGRAQVGRIELEGKRKGLKAMQVEATRTIPMSAGTHVLTFDFTPLEGKSLSESLIVDIPTGGTVNVVADVGTLGRALQVRIR